MRGIETYLLLELIRGRDILPTAKTITDWRKCFRIASVNRVLFHLINQLYPLRNELALIDSEAALFEEVYLRGKEAHARYVRTLQFWHETSERLGIEYRLIKTYKAVPHIVNDLDILVFQKDFERAHEALSKIEHGRGTERDGHQYDFNYTEYIPIDLHATWEKNGSSLVLVNGTKFVDSDFVWEKSETFTVDGVTVLKPSATADQCLTMVNTIFGHFYLSLNELHTYNTLSHQIDSGLIQHQAEKHDWRKALDLYLDLISRCNAQIALNQGFQMPRVFSYRDIAVIFLEKYRSRLGLTNVDLFNSLYLNYAKARYYLTRGTRVPIHGHWAKCLES